ncbi:acyltransferase family protein [Rhizobium mesoamericanum]|uniref:Putative acyltranferase n=1 Tax=Rhizobium mesoamericanum STM3625 TaxID=1211777 RepID=K0Q4P1_9HYPH|nr:acyltransferase [Rhizobium mesoamericanum]CCM79562.1 putative acyltranferase [Rhizobium mesoamericanum STM3625]
MHQENQGRIQFADTLRALAAASVVLSHFYGVFWYKRDAVLDLVKVPGNPEVSGVPFYIAWLHLPPFNFGAFGVGLFFLISGFVIPMSLGRYDAARFLIGRFFRIVPTYVVGFAISLSVLYYNTASRGLDFPIPFRHVLVHFFPGIRDVLGTTNIDGIIWTLEIEMKFYLVCAIAAPFFRKRSPLVFLLPIAIGVIALFIEASPGLTFATVAGRMSFTSQFLVFMFAGTAFYYAHTGALSERSGLLLATLLIFAFAILWKLFPGAAFDQLWSYATAFALFWLAFNYQHAFAVNRVTKFLANISYPLYVVHAVVGYTLLLALTTHGFRSSVSLLLTTAVVIALAYLIHIWVEKPSQSLNTITLMGGALPAE